MFVLRMLSAVPGFVANAAIECVRPRRLDCYWGGPRCFTTRDPVLRDAHHYTNHAGDR